MNISKYTGIGNDFIIVRYEENMDYSSFAVKYCDRHMGVGADGLIIVKLDFDKDNKKTFEMIFYNQDGSIGLMCGNGIRCFVKYCVDNNLFTN